MKLRNLAQSLDLVKLSSCDGSATHDDASDITHGYASDLLSDVLAHAPPGGILVTVQVQPDVVTVASMAGLRAVIFALNRTPDGHTIDRAAQEGLSLYTTPVDAFEVVGRLYSLGVRGGTPPGRNHRGVVVEERPGRYETDLDSLEPCPEGST